ncbi:acyltransferase family protein [Coralloluteibacterium stylophorae]|uniref:Acyltransferase n=1 Tax=Coralloluteibacterium stylophorae TaxID=1776034 RepID=A0A8J7VWJ1_9GAMM|nr:acyltransferase [Coralloluteibacterium stylophorae]MBS7456250.1 acyltransferase [Coralloluteibacterium stylophorae]
MPHDSTPPPQRIAWIDCLKGVAIALVVVHHGIEHLLFALGMDSRAVEILDALFVRFRMGAFFLASGILAASALGRGLPDFLDRKLVPLAWTLVVWTLVGSLFGAWVAPLYREQALPSLADVVVNPQGNLWFVHALIVFNAVCYAALRAPRAVASLSVVAAVVLYLGVPDLPPVLYRILEYYPFFAAGALFGHGIVEFFRVPARVWTALAAGSAMFAAAAGAELAGVDSDALVLVMRVAAVAAAIACIRLLTRWRPVATALGYLGRNSLYIFLLHQFLIALMRAAYEAGWPLPGSDLGLLATATAVALGGSLLLKSLLMRAGAGWLFAPPPALRRRGRHADASRAGRRRVRDLRPAAVAALPLLAATGAAACLAAAPDALAIRLLGDLPLGSFVAPLVPCGLAGAAVVLATPRAAPRRLSVASLTLAAAWLPVSVALAGNLALQFRGWRGAAWLGFSLAVMLGALAALGWTLTAAARARHRRRVAPA